MKMDRVYPSLCKQHSCLKRADYEFTDIQDGETITLAYACSNHIESVRGMLEDIYKPKIEVKSA